MLLNIIKYKSLRRAIRGMTEGLPVENIGPEIGTVGVILDQKDFSDIGLFVNELKKRGVQKEAVSFLIFNHDKSTNLSEGISFKSSDFSSSGELRNEKVKEFLNKPFDMLINYYDTEAIILVWASAYSKARLKVGFSSIKTPVNHFSIELATNKYKEYIDELFKYIKLLKQTK